MKKSSDLIDKVNHYFNQLNDRDCFDVMLVENRLEGIAIDKTFALVKWLIKDKTGIVLHDEQLCAAFWLLQNCVVEMNTGEGKTFAIFLAAAYFAMKHESVHIVTANQYLVKRDAEQADEVLRDLGVTISYVHEEMAIEDKQNAYKQNIVYGTASGFILDYLKDQEIQNRKDKRQAIHEHVIIDELDSVLIDEARQLYKTPYLNDEYHELYSYSGLLLQCVPGKHYVVDDINQNLSITEEGYILIENWLVEQGLINQAEALYFTDNDFHYRDINNLLYAQSFLYKGEHYLIENQQVVLLDKKGRRQATRCFENGVHQAIQAINNLPITPEMILFNVISIRAYFSKYLHLCGITGTAMEDSEEYWQMYGLDVVSILPHQPSQRIDLPNKVFINEAFKAQAIINDIEKYFLEKRPVLVGVLTVDKAEEISRLLDDKNIPHQKLSAKYHDQEAEILENAGRLGMVTLITPMAGRGVDIVLGGKKRADKEWLAEHQKVKQLGGLVVIGVERYDVVRIDKQLRGRCGRQGDPGVTQFYLSLQDKLLVNFSNNAISRFLETTALMNGESIEMSFLDKAILKAQNRLRGLYFAERKRIYDYDRVLELHAELYHWIRKIYLDKPNESLFEIDRLWREHISLMLEMKKSILWRSMTGLDVSTEYKIAAFEIFKDFISKIRII